MLAIEGKNEKKEKNLELKKKRNTKWEREKKDDEGLEIWRGKGR